MNHCDKIKENAAAFPENYWVHTSSNEAVKKIIQMSGNITTKREIERLLAGEMTKDLALITTIENPTVLNSEGFIKAIAKRL